MFLSPLLFPPFDQRNRAPLLNHRETWVKIIQPVSLNLVFVQTELLTESSPIDGALVEGHDVLRQGACLVTEDVLDLAQLLIERGGPRLGGSVVLRVIHLPVPVDEEAVPQSDDLHTDISMDTLQ